MKENNKYNTSLNKYISDTGVCSRRKADEFIKAGRVTINGKVARPGNRVSEGDKVLLDGKPLKQKEKTVYLAFNKPRGIICTTDENAKDNIISYIEYPQRIFPVGRLDVASEGLILLTNDGDVVNKILRASNNHEKEYIVSVDKAISADFIRRMSNGIPILETVTKKCEVEKINTNVFRIVLTQGLNRQIRRMCEHLGYEVKKLKRIRIINIKLGRLELGKWRELTPLEEKEMKKRVKYSEK